MNKFAVLALVGAVSANQAKKEHKTLWDAAMMIMNAMDDTSSSQCVKAPEENINGYSQTRMFMGAVWRGWVQGFYQENADVVSADCFGDWMEHDFLTVWGTAKKIRADSFGVDVKEAETAAVTAIDAWYKNRDECQIVKVRDDGWNWCLANSDKCLFLKDAEGRIFDASVPLAAKGMDLLKLMLVDDSCYTVKEQVAEVHRIFEDIGEVMGTIWGFDLTWAQSDNAQRVHLAKKPFLKKVRQIEKAAHMTEEEIFQGAFPVSSELVDDSIKEFSHDMEDAYKTVESLLFPPVHHHAKAKKAVHKVPHHNAIPFFDPFNPFQQFPAMQKQINHFF